MAVVSTSGVSPVSQVAGGTCACHGLATSTTATTRPLAAQSACTRAALAIHLPATTRLPHRAPPGQTGAITANNRSQSVGHIPAADRILEATYKALSLLPTSYLPEGFTIPHLQQPLPAHAIPSGVRSRMASPHASGYNTPRVRPPPLSQSLFALCWIALAGFTTDADTAAFLPFISTALNTPGDRFTLTNGE